MKKTKRTELDLLTIIYVAILTFGVGGFVVHPSWAGLAALACMIPAVAINFAFPARRKAGAR
jgi:hypothetical protein